jgi:hypothetical protein
MSIFTRLASSLGDFKWHLGIAAVLGCQALASAALVAVPRTGVSVLSPDTVDPIGNFDPDFYNFENRTPDDNKIDVILDLGAPVQIDHFTWQNRTSATTNAVPWIFRLEVGDGVDDGITFGGGLGQFQVAQVNTAGYVHDGVDLPDYAPKRYVKWTILRTINGDSGTNLNSHVRDILYEAVPEPAALGLLATGLPLILRRNRKQEGRV